MKRVKTFNKFLNENHANENLNEAYVEVEGVWPDNKKDMMPGGSPEEVKSDYNLTTSDEGDGMYTYSGSKEDIAIFLDDYGLEDLEIMESNGNQIYEAYNPAEQKKRIGKRQKVLMAKDAKYKEQLSNAEARGDTLQSAIIKNRIDINQLEKEKIILKIDIIALKIKKMKG